MLDRCSATPATHPDYPILYPYDAILEIAIAPVVAVFGISASAIAKTQVSHDNDRAV
jgi:hypothetical protein